MKRIIYKSREKEKVCFLKKEKENCWIDLENPSERELEEISKKFGLSIEDLKDALDEDEIPRISKEKGYTFIILRVPIVTKEGISTSPLGTFYLKDCLITIHKEKLDILSKFYEDKILFSTKKRVRLLLKIMREIIYAFTINLRNCERKIREIEKSFLKYTKNEDIVALMAIKEDILDMQNAILENNKVFEAILLGHHIKLYRGDEEIIADLIIDNKQCITMATFFIKVADNTQKIMEWLISNNYNILMKKLTSITVILSLPVILSGFYGMNVVLPLQENNNAFFILLGFSFILSFIAWIIFKIKGWI